MNNRPIKFRIWDSSNKEWVEGPCEYLQLEKVFSPNEGTWHENTWVFQQFTGALDKNQKQIFEGDIVLFDNPDPYDGQDQLTKIVGYNSRVMGFRLYNFTHEVDKYGGQVFFPEEVEVIGNIFEGAIKDGINYGEYLKEK